MCLILSKKGRCQHDKNIFIPERIGPYFIFPQRTAGIEINTTHIYATVVVAQGKRRTIEKLIDEPIAPSNTLTYQDRVVVALKSLALKLGPIDEICCVLPSSAIIFKELSLPFLGLKRIKSVIPFEVEALLPFSLDHATIDCIISREDKKLPETDVLVAAVKNEVVELYNNYFQAAGLTLSKLSVDMFELYGLYSFIAPEADHKKTIALIAIESHQTRCAVIVQGQLKYIRSLPKGISEANLTQGNSGLEDLVSEIGLSITAYTQKLKSGGTIEKILLVGGAGEIPGLVTLIEHQLKSSVQFIQPKELIHSGTIQSKVTTLSQNFIISIAAALSIPLTQEFNLLQRISHEKEDRRITSQIIALGALALLIFFTFSLYSFLRIRTLRVSANAAETEALQELKKNFKLKPAQSVTLEAANKAASNELKRQETAWRHLSPENRYAFLRYLTELSKCINVKDAQLEITQLSIKEDTIKLYGSVPGYQQLTKLQNQLTCPLFKKVSKLQDLNFKSDPITLTINREEL